MHKVQRDFSTMRARAADKGLRRIEALTLRQLSYLYYDSERLNASVEFAEQALQLFELHGPVSDTDLLKAHLSLTHLRLGDRAKALFYFEQISFRPDERARLPVAVLKYLLIGEPVELANFQSISARWRLLFEECAHPGREQLRKFRWIASTGLIFDGKENSCSGAPWYTGGAGVADARCRASCKKLALPRALARTGRDGTS